MEEIIRLPLQPLTEEAFRAYGELLSADNPLYPEVDDGVVSLRLQINRHRTKRLDLMAYHGSYNQSFIPLVGSMVLVLSPPPVNIDDERKDYKIDYDKLAAFVIEPGQAVLIGKGVGHNAVPVGAECRLVNVTRKHEAIQKQNEDFISGKGGSLRGTDLIEFINILERDNRVIELEF